jgi:hypothetical protein
VCGERAAPEPIIGGSTGSCCITQVAYCSFLRSTLDFRSSARPV